MKEPTPNLTRALEDLQVIRTVLDKASPSFQTLAASFRVLGILWLVPAGLLAFLQGESQISYLFALDHGIALYAGPNLLLLLQGAIVLLAAVFCLLWQGKKRRGAFSPEEAKVVTLWQVLLLLFLVCTVAGMVGTSPAPYRRRCSPRTRWMGTGPSTSAGLCRPLPLCSSPPSPC